MAGLPPHIRASPNTLALSFSLQPHFVCRSIKPEFADPKQANREVPARLSKLSFTIIYGTNEARPGDEVTLGAGEKLTRIHMATWELTGLPPILFKARSTRFRGLVVRCFGVGGVVLLPLVLLTTTVMSPARGLSSRAPSAPGKWGLCLEGCVPCRHPRMADR